MVDDDTNCSNVTFSSESVELKTHKISTITLRLRKKQWNLGPDLGMVQVFSRLTRLNWIIKFHIHVYLLSIEM